MARNMQLLQSTQFLQPIELLQMTKICKEYAEHLRWYTVGILCDFIKYFQIFWKLATIFLDFHKSAYVSKVAAALVVAAASWNLAWMYFNTPSCYL